MRDDDYGLVLVRYHSETRKPWYALQCRLCGYENNGYPLSTYTKAMERLKGHWATKHQRELLCLVGQGRFF